MTTPLPDPEQQVPDEVVTDAPVVISVESILAAKAELEQAALDAKSGRWSRVFRTLTQGTVAAAFLAAAGTVYDAFSTGHADPKTVLFLAANAALTAVVSYAHNKVAPADK